MGRQHRPKLGGGIRPSKTYEWGGGGGSRIRKDMGSYLSIALVIFASAPVKVSSIPRLGPCWKSREATLYFYLRK